MHSICLTASTIFITIVFTQRLPAKIGNLKKLRVLDLEENRLESLPQEIGKFCSFLFLYKYIPVIIFTIFVNIYGEFNP